MDNREIILQFTEAFDTNDQETILNALADDVEWNIVGESIILGKEKMADFFKENSAIKILSSTRDHVIVEGDRVAVDGQMKCVGPDELVQEMYYCDIYELQNSKIKKMISYIVSKKTSA